MNLYKIRTACFLSILFFSLKATSQNQFLDSLKLELEHHDKNDTIRVMLLSQLGMASWNYDHAKGESLVDESIKLSVKLKWKKGEAMGLLTRSNIKTWNLMHNEAMLDVLNALKINDKLNNKQLTVHIYSRLSAINRNIGDYKSAEEYCLKYLEAATELKDKKQILKATVNLADFYAGNKDWKKAQKYLDGAMNLAIEQKNKYDLGRILMIYASKESELKNYSEAKKILLQNLSIQKELNEYGGVAFIETNLSIIYSYLNNRDSAYYYANEANEVTKKYNLKKEPIDVYYALYFAALTFKEYEKALQYYKVYDSLGSESDNMETGRKLENTKYRFEKEKNDLFALRELQRQKVFRNGFLAGFLVVLLFAGIFLVQRNKISKERKRSDELLLNILPEEVAEELKAKGSAEAKQFDEVTVLFTDFKEFTELSEKLTPKELVADLNHCFSAFDEIAHKHGIEKIKTIGDAYMAAGGLPTPNKTHAKDVVLAALEICDFIEKGKAQKIAAGLPYFEIRIGIHTGPLVAGIVGIKKFQYDIWGDTVNTASRIESNGDVGKVNISQATYELLKNDANFTFESRGKIAAKGKGEIEMHFVEVRI